MNYPSIPPDPNKNAIEKKTAEQIDESNKINKIMIAFNRNIIGFFASLVSDISKLIVHLT